MFYLIFASLICLMSYATIFSVGARLHVCCVFLNAFYPTENCTNDYVLFHAASTLKEAVIREWSLLSSDHIQSLRSSLLAFVTQRSQWVQIWEISSREIFPILLPSQIAAVCTRANSRYFGRHCEASTVGYQRGLFWRSHRHRSLGGQRWPLFGESIRLLIISFNIPFTFSN